MEDGALSCQRSQRLQPWPEAGSKLDNDGGLQHNGTVRFQVATAAVCLIWLSLGEVAAQEAEPSAEVDELLAAGWHLYSEELEFEQAAEVYGQVVANADASDEQLLEALEYLSACQFALGDQDAAREALVQLLEIDEDQRLNDPSHPPDLLALLEEVRTAPPEPEPGPDPEPNALSLLGPDTPVEPEPEPEPPPIVETNEDDTTETGRRAWYRTWWFWTIAGAVVIGAVTTAVVLSVPGETEEPPPGQLEPGVVQLPVGGFRF